MSGRTSFEKLRQELERDPVRRKRMEEERKAHHEVLALTSEGAVAFVEAITNPPEPNENLRALAREARLARKAREGENP